MKKPVTTFYVFACHRWKTPMRGPRLLKFSGIVQHTTRGSARVRLTERSEHFGYRTVVARESLDLTPEAALDRYKEGLAKDIARLTKELAQKQRLFDRCPDEPGKVYEDV